MIRFFRFMKHVSGLLLAAGVAVSATTAYAQNNSIESVNVSGQQGGATLIRVALKNAPTATPASFAVNSPPRIAFDFPNTTNGSGKNVQEVGEGDVRRGESVVENSFQVNELIARRLASFSQRDERGMSIGDREDALIDAPAVFLYVYRGSAVADDDLVARGDEVGEIDPKEAAVNATLVLHLRSEFSDEIGELSAFCCCERS
jgi:hypothetical protein